MDERHLSLPMLSNYSASALDKQSDEIIECYKQQLGSRTERLGFVYLNALFYRRGGDAWISESWWIEKAKRYLNPFGYEKTSRALEILMLAEPELYRQTASDYLDYCCRTGWAICEEGHRDTSYLAALLPEHPINHDPKIPSDSAKTEQLNAEWMRGQKARATAIVEELEAIDPSRSISSFSVMGAKVINEHVDHEQRRRLKTFMVKHASLLQKQLVLHGEALLRLAVGLNCPETTEALLNNRHYLSELAGVLQDENRFLLASPFSPHVLSFSLLLHDETAGRMAAKALESCTHANCSFEDQLASAISWKRYRAGAKLGTVAAPG